MINNASIEPSGAPAVSLPAPVPAELTGIDWGGLPHFCSGLHNVPDTPDILIGLLDADHALRARAVWDLYRLLLNDERVFPATAPAALVVAALLDDPRTLAAGEWERRAGRRPLRAELLNWLASFADVARLDPEDGVGAPQDLAAARAARPALHARVAVFCEDGDPQVREAAIAATALLLADPALAVSVPQHVPAVRDVLGRSADSYYRWIARERLESWGEDITALIAAAEERRAALAWARTPPEDPFDESRERWLAEQPQDTAALEPPVVGTRTGRRRGRRSRTGRQPNRPQPSGEANRGTRGCGGSPGTRSARSGRSRRTSESDRCTSE